GVFKAEDSQAAANGGAASQPAAKAGKQAKGDAAQAAGTQAKAADDLALIEGIGPKIAEILQAGGIASFADLAAAPVERLKELLTEAGSNFATHDPGTWPEQAALAAKGDWEQFEKLKAELVGGKRA